MRQMLIYWPSNFNRLADPGNIRTNRVSNACIPPSASNVSCRPLPSDEHELQERKCCATHRTMPPVDDAVHFFHGSHHLYIHTYWLQEREKNALQSSFLQMSIRERARIGIWIYRDEEQLTHCMRSQICAIHIHAVDSTLSHIAQHITWPCITR